MATFPDSVDSFIQGGGDRAQAEFNILMKNSTGKTVATKELPWDQLSVGSKVNPFLPPVTLDGSRWDQLFPYRLLVIDVSKNNQIVNGTGPSSGSSISVSTGAGSALIDFVDSGTQWIFTLPITPQQLNIQDNFSINTVATLRGVLEEHNGVKFKTISAQGTMGVWPFRASLAKPPSSPSVLQSVFGGTIEAFGNVVNQATSLINSVTSNSPANKPNTPRPTTDGLGTGSGYDATGLYNAQKLQQFLEQYAEAKKSPRASHWRLVFDIPKQNQSYICTPMQYVWQQSANKPMEINYSIQFKAWRRIDLSANVTVTPPNVQTISPGIMQRILNTLSTARSLVSSSLSLISAVRSDIEAPLNALRQTTLLAKDIAGAVVTAADLRAQLVKDYKNAVNNFLTTVSSLNNLTGSAATNPAVTSPLKALQSASAAKEGLSLDAVSGGQLGTSAANSQSIDPAYNVFTSPDSNFALFDQVPVSSLTLNTAQQNAYDNLILSARAITVDDLKTYRSIIQNLAQQLANNFGAGDAFTSKVYGLPPPISRVAPMTLDNYELLKALYDVLQSYDILTATTQIDDQNKQSNMDYVAGLAATAGIQFNTSATKVLMPVPFGLTIEAIAARYLKDPQRWLEIVTLNNLKDPYIDEDGFQLPLLSNASGRQITVGDNFDLYLGQRVLLQSSTQLPTARAILNIERLSDTSFLITLDGVPNLDGFLLADKAYLQAYLPGTVNSQQKIFIPSDLALPDDPNIIIPSAASGDPLSGLSKVDWLLTDTGDLAVNNFGDLRYSYGMTNIMQALKIKFGTSQGTMLLHPEFGLGIKPGTANSTVRLKDLSTQINNMIIADPRFAGVSNLQLILQGPALSMNVGVYLAGLNGVFPLTFNLTSTT